MEQLFRSLPDVLRDLGPNQEADQALVFAAWARCAGEMLTQRTQPLQYFENRLIIAVEDKMWRRHLEDLSPRMVASLNASLGEGAVRFIEFRIDASVIPRRQPLNVSGSETVENIDPTLEAAAGQIADESLRQSFLEAATGCLAKV